MPYKQVLEQLSSLAPSRYLFRVMAVGVLIMLLISLFPWAERLVGRALNFPDLRHQVSINLPNETKSLPIIDLSPQDRRIFYTRRWLLNPYNCHLLFKDSPSLIQVVCNQLSKSDVVSNNNDSDTAVLTVINLGFGMSENVLIHVNAQSDHIIDYQIDSQELYEVKTVNLEDGIIDIWLDRLASGSGIHIILSGTDFASDEILLSASSDQGSSVSIDAPNLSSQVDIYATQVTELFTEAGDIIWESPRVQDQINQLYTNPGFTESFKTILGHEFKVISLAALIVIVLIMIFLPRFFLLAIPFLIAFVVWLFFDTPLSIFIFFVTLLFFGGYILVMSGAQAVSTEGQSSSSTQSRSESHSGLMLYYGRQLTTLEYSLRQKEQDYAILLDIYERRIAEFLQAYKKKEAAYNILLRKYEKQIAQTQQNLGDQE